MNINSLQEATTYTNNAGPPVDNSQARGQSLETSNTDLNTEGTAATQKAFEVTLTPEAQGRMAASSTQQPSETQATDSENQNNQNVTQTQEINQFINIVA